MNIIQSYVNKKFEMWLITHYYDNKYISDNYITKKEKDTQTTQECTYNNLVNCNSTIQEICSKYINEIDNIHNIPLKYKTICNINNNCDNILIDSFYDKHTTIYEHINTIFTENTYNIVIYGAGPCGLYLANLLKNYYENKIGIIIIENRIKRSHIKKSYTRRWLTNIPASIFKGDTKIKRILMEFGKKDYIGCHVNILESLLYLSCRSKGVKFIFNNTYTTEILKSIHVDLVFNATGNFLFNKNVITIKNTVPFSFKKVKFNKLDYYKNNYNPNIDIEKIQLEQHDNIIYSTYKNKPVSWYIIKIINIPVDKYDELNRLIKILNIQDNKIYLWKGTFKNEINESLIFINVNKDEIEMLLELNRRIILRELINHTNFTNLSNKIIVLLNYLSYLYPDNNIIIEKPFIYKPYINTTPIINKNNKMIINIGDSLFNGDPKLGDGLGWHLDIINKICDSIKTILP